MRMQISHLLNASTGEIETGTLFNYANDLFLTASGNLAVGSWTETARIYNQDLISVSPLGTDQRQFVTHHLSAQGTPTPTPTTTPSGTHPHSDTDVDTEAHPNTETSSNTAASSRLRRVIQRCGFDWSSTNAVSFSSAGTTKRFPSRCA